MAARNIHQFGDGIKIGYSDTNYVEVSAAGDINYVAGSGLQFGEIYYMGAGFDTTCTTEDVYVQVLGFATNGESNGGVTPDHTNDHITVTYAGRYMISVNVSARSALADGYQFMVKCNNGTVDCENIMIHRDVATAARVVTGSCTGICDLPAGATVELWVRNIDTAGRDITIEHVNLNVVQVGGTT